MLKPKITVGQKINLFGIEATVTEVTPYSDYCWTVTVSAVNGGGAAESFNIFVPTDFHTGTGRNAWTDK